MMTSFSSQGLLLLAGLCFLLPRTQTTYHKELDNDPSIDPFQCRKVAFTISNVSISLYKEMAQKSRNGNILFSPIRVVAAILMLSLGVKGNVSQHILEALRFNKTGLPEAEIHKCFQYLLRAVNQPTGMSPLKSGGSMFIHQGLKLVDKSVKRIKDIYFSEVISTNFSDSSSAKRQINNYMMKKTNKEILNMVKELKKDTFLALMNYIIWNGRIVSDFECQFIQMEDFHLEYRKTIKVAMVTNVDMYHLFRVEELSSMVLVYGYTLVTYIIIPDKGKMHQVEERLTYPHFRQMIQRLNLRIVKVHTPVLSVSETSDVVSMMSLLGITPFFNKEANCTVAAEDTPQKSFKVISKAVLTLENMGTRPPMDLCLKNELWANAPLVQINRPFLIFIQDSTNYAPLFLGRVANPRK
ncbi:hypothetical protein A6R68_07811, partial [Neotoma lepida]